MNYNITVCYICKGLMSLQQLREGVYWLPDMDNFERYWGRIDGYVHRFAHRACWQNLKEKRRELIRLCSFKSQEPRSLGQRV
jgi:hypothetical protein